jgi:hypothetical protein
MLARRKGRQSAIVRDASKTGYHTNRLAASDYLMDLTATGQNRIVQVR